MTDPNYFLRKPLRTRPTDTQTIADDATTDLDISNNSNMVRT